MEKVCGHFLECSWYISREIVETDEEVLNLLTFVGKRVSRIKAILQASRKTARHPLEFEGASFGKSWG